MKFLYLLPFLIIMTKSFSEESFSIKKIIETNQTGISVGQGTRKDLVRSFYPNGKVKEQQRDMNNDGKMDQIIKYNKNGTISSKLDLNFDGIFEKEFIQFFTGKNITFEKITMDLNADKKVDYILTRSYFSKYKSYFERVKIDSNFDGIFDTDNLTKKQIQIWTNN